MRKIMAECVQEVLIKIDNKIAHRNGFRHIALIIYCEGNFYIGLEILKEGLSIHYGYSDYPA